MSRRSRDEEEEVEVEDPYERGAQRPQHHLARYLLVADREEEEEEEDEQHQREQFAYDSMSTILEVDSEGSEPSLSQERRDPRLELLHHQVPPNVEQQPEEQSQQQKRVSPVSPAQPDRLSGALSALAQQVERLRRRSAEVSSGSGLKDAAEGKEPENPATSSDNANQSGDDATATSSPMPSESATTTTTETPKKSEDEGEEDEVDDDKELEEELMMIALSPLGSPRIRLPQTMLRRRAGGGVGSPGSSVVAERPVVEVSNKSTITAIDLQLMDRMVERFFVERRNKASQTIEFDCEPPATKPSGATRSVGVGTEKFSRERFSLLPATNTRSTQTKPPAPDYHDPGQSETRRFKLNHQHFAPVRRPTSRLPEAQEELSSEKKASGGDRAKTPNEAKSDSLSASPVASRPTETQSSLKKVEAAKAEEEAKEAQKDSLSPPPPSTKKQQPPVEVESSQSGAESADSLVVAAARQNNQSDATKPAEGNKKEQVAAAATEAAAQPIKKDEVQAAKTGVPSVKTELRVIIEFKDSKRRQVSELRSNSELHESGRLSKRTEVSNSRQVCVSPRQVLAKLDRVGRQHSLQLGAARSTPSLAEAQQPPDAGDAAASALNWRQVSQSSVRNEIETEAGERWWAGRRGGGGQTQLVMSSDATIRELDNERSSIGLVQRALRREEAAGGTGGGGQVKERCLVESKAAFNENDVTQAAPEAATKTGHKISATKSGSRPNSPTKRRPTVAAAPPPQTVPVEQGSPKIKRQPRAQQTQPTSSPSPHSAEQTKRSARLEIEEERDERRQVSRNGRLVYDDRLRERHFETQSAQSPLSPVTGMRSRRHTPTPTGRSPLSPHQLLRPVQLPPVMRQAGDTNEAADLWAPPPLMFADQTSQLSSDPETMDSGFAQSGAGSGSALNLLRAGGGARSPLPARPQLQRVPRRAGGQRGQPTPATLSGSLESLEFVDADEEEDADELIRQLDTTARRQQQQQPHQPPPSGAGRRRHLSASPALGLNQTSNHSNQRQQHRSPTPVHQRAQAEARKDQLASTTGRRSVEQELGPLEEVQIEPPAAFASGSASRKEERPKGGGGQRETEVSTRLSRRSRRRPDATATGGQLQRELSQSASSQRTQTRLEQRLMAPLGPDQREEEACHIRAQAMFESDTDSMAERQSAGSGASSNRVAHRAAHRPPKPKKELVSETRFSRATSTSHQSGADVTNMPEKPIAPPESWDYSLRVNRMRDNQVDSKVNTYIKHSRQQPLINLEAG